MHRGLALAAATKPRNQPNPAHSPLPLPVPSTNTLRAPFVLQRPQRRAHKDKKLWKAARPSKVDTVQATPASDGVASLTRAWLFVTAARPRWRGRRTATCGPRANVRGRVRVSASAANPSPPLSVCLIHAWRPWRPRGALALFWPSAAGRGCRWSASLLGDKQRQRCRCQWPRRGPRRRLPCLQSGRPARSGRQ